MQEKEDALRPRIAAGNLKQAFTGMLLGAAIVGLSACASVPFDTPRTVTTTAPADGTLAQRISNGLTGGAPNSVAVTPLPDGNEALGARIRLIAAADRSIDIKTFLVKPDASGALVWLALFDAAERGVRVRLLIDDVFTTANDDQIAALDAHPNVEIRYFNPLPRGLPLPVSFLLEFSRVNRRMHNKAFIVDGSLAIIGGRNYANEYYQIETENEFADFDIFVAGQPVKELSSAFDMFWNDEWAVPASAFAVADEEELTKAREFLGRVANSEAAQRFRPAARSRFVDDLRERDVPFFRGRARVIVDDPAKLRSPPYKGPYVVANSLYNVMNQAQTDVLVLTPYFVPEDYGADFFERLAERGVRVRIVTNSLAATNHAYVHGAYSKYRDRLLDAGVEFVEVRADAPSLVEGVESTLTMHTKLAIVDGRVVFVGSTNIDPRSIRQNSEIGMVIDSRDLARAITQRVDGVAHDYAFKLERDAEGDTQWRYESNGREEVYRNEPGAGLIKRIVATIAGWLPIESQL